jgi:Tfp pilus assembly protein PilF
LTSHQVSYWRNTQTLMTHALRIDPNNYVAHQNLGRYFAEIGQPELAREHRQKLRELDPVFVRSTDRR